MEKSIVVFWPFVHTITAFSGPENATLLKRVPERNVLKMQRLRRRQAERERENYEKERKKQREREREVRLPKKRRCSKN